MDCIDAFAAKLDGIFFCATALICKDIFLGKRIFSLRTARMKVFAVLHDLLRGVRWPLLSTEILSDISFFSFGTPSPSSVLDYRYFTIISIDYRRTFS